MDFFIQTVLPVITFPVASLICASDLKEEILQLSHFPKSIFPTSVSHRAVEDCLLMRVLFSERDTVCKLSYTKTIFVICNSLDNITGINVRLSFVKFGSIAVILSHGNLQQEGKI